MAKEATPAICVFFLDGGCLRGARCKFAHTKIEEVCRFYARGKCSSGASCVYLHGDLPTPIAKRSSSEKTPAAQGDDTSTMKRRKAGDLLAKYSMSAFLASSGAPSSLATVQKDEDRDAVEGVEGEEDAAVYGGSDKVVEAIAEAAVKGETKHERTEKEVEKEESSFLAFS